MLTTDIGRLQLALCVVEQCWSLRRAAERFQVSVPTAARWAQRYREHGLGAIIDRSCRPHYSPRRTATRIERRIIAVRVNRRWGPARIGYLRGIHPSTVHRVLSRYRLAKLAWLDRGTLSAQTGETSTISTFQSDGAVVIQGVPVFQPGDRVEFTVRWFLVTRFPPSKPRPN